MTQLILAKEGIAEPDVDTIRMRLPNECRAQRIQLQVALEMFVEQCVHFDTRIERFGCDGFITATSCGKHTRGSQNGCKS